MTPGVVGCLKSSGAGVDSPPSPIRSSDCRVEQKLARANKVGRTCLCPSAAAARKPAVTVADFVFPACCCALGWFEVAIKAVYDVPGGCSVCEITCFEVVDGQFDLGLDKIRVLSNVDGWRDVRADGRQLFSS